MEETANMGAADMPSGQYPAVDAFCLGIKRALLAIEPPAEVTAHFRNARIEVLKGLRELIDHRIRHLSRGQQMGRKITVE